MVLNVCAEPGCPSLTCDRRCPTHQRQTEQRHGSRQQRGYELERDAIRAAWGSEVCTGTVRCANPNCRRPRDPLNHPDEPWDLGHRTDHTGYRGAEHSTCNRSESGRAANRTR